MPGITPYTRAPQEMPQVQDESSEINRGFELAHRSRLEREAKQERLDNEYLTDAKLDPIWSGNAAIQDLQAKNIKSFEDDLTQTYHKYRNQGYKIPVEERAKIQQNKTALIGWQMKIQQGEKQLQELNSLAQKDVTQTKYDHDHLNHVNQDWRGGYKTDEMTGEPILDKDGKKVPMTEIPNNALQPAMPQSWDDAFGKGIAKHYNTKETTIDHSTGKAIEKTVIKNFDDDPEKAKEKIGELMMEPGHEGWQKKALLEIHSLPVDQQSEWINKIHSDAKKGLGEYMLENHPDEIWQEKHESKELIPRKEGNAKKVIQGMFNESTSSEGQRYIEDTDPIKPASSKNGKVKINNEGDAKKIIAKTNKNKDETEAIEDWEKNKRSAKKSSPVTLVNSIKDIPKTAEAFIPEGIDIDIDTGKKSKNPSGEGDFTKMTIDYHPWNVEKQEWAKNNEWGDISHIKPGYKVVPFLIARDANGKETKARLLTEPMLKSIEDQPNNKWKRPVNFKWSLGKQSKEEKNANDDFEQYKRK